MGRRQSRRARLTLIVVVLAAVIAVHEVTATPGHSLAARAAVAMIDEYRAHVGPRLGRFTRCRFQPTCSADGRAAIRKYGFIKGGAKTAMRIARCGPWTPAGTVDVP